MSNELATIENFEDIVNNFGELSDTQLDAIQDKINEARFIKISNELRKVNNRLDKMEEQREIDSNMSQAQLDLEIKRHRVEEHRYGYVSLSDLGQCYQVSIGAKTVGKLLRLAGLAKAKQSKTEPLRSALVDKTAKSIMYGDIPTYQWNPERCIEKIDKWLNDIEVIDKFYAIESEKKLTKFITELELTYNK